MTLNKHKLFTPLLMTSLLTLCLVSCSPNSSVPSTPNEPLRRTQFMMGTSITISLYDHQDDAILDEAFALVEDLENQLSINKSNTLLDEVNDNSGIQPIPINESMFEVIQKGLYYSELTDGSFDITVGPLVKLWNIGFPDARVPSSNEIIKALPLVDYTLVSLDEVNKTAYLSQSGMMLDLGGIAKGYTADEIVDLLQSHGVNHAIVDLGGNVYTLGTKVDGSSWKVGVQDPFNPRGDIIGSLPTSNKSIVTSGIYERYLEEDGKKYHHILDPSTGYPFDNEIAGVTIVSDYSIDGDALSTSVFSKGIQDGLTFVESLEGIDAIFISTDKKVYVTEGLKNEFNLTNDTFELVE
ncbi:MAG: FAD:protein FMN transferase [Cellulosilyticaceae bacterium]